MKKLMIIAAVVTVAILALGVAGFAYAQSGQPTPIPFTPGWMRGGAQNGQGYGPGMMGRGNQNGQTQPGYGPGMMGGAFGARGRGMMGGRFGANGQFGPMHDQMMGSLAKALNVKVEDLNAALAKGTTPYQFAKDKGLTDEQIQKVMDTAHEEALKAAVAAGTLTQQQADWMEQRHDSMMNGNWGSMPCQGGQAPAQPTK
jgi:hypothetical protein